MGVTWLQFETVPPLSHIYLWHIHGYLCHYHHNFTKYVQRREWCNANIKSHYLFQYLKAVLPTSVSTMKYNHSMGLVVFFLKCFSMERLEWAVQALLEV